ncbi:unnamed protein product [Soboliphyme baturini]|uniref:Uncharacterized protein n=1 Tax=Soboliphyme baturini TaxID=241478 RepID=A0A183ISI3_9BILA|nr:unnamed protein product [Soboliphyme baturini]
MSIVVCSATDDHRQTETPGAEDTEVVETLFRGRLTPAATANSVFLLRSQNIFNKAPVFAPMATCPVVMRRLVASHTIMRLETVVCKCETRPNVFRIRNSIETRRLLEPLEPAGHEDPETAPD